MPDSVQQRHREPLPWEPAVERPTPDHTPPVMFDGPFGGRHVHGDHESKERMLAACRKSGFTGQRSEELVTTALRTARRKRGLDYGRG